MALYHFLTGEFKEGSTFDPAAASARMFAWFDRIGEPVDRYGGKSGKVVKFSQKNYEKTLFAPDTISIELFSPRILPKDEADEASNCDALAVYSPKFSLLLAMRADKLSLEELFQGAFAMPGLLEQCNYLYGYSETLGYGSGYARGYFQEDAAHPATFGRRDPANNWGAIKRQGRQDAYLRDVYPINAFTDKKIGALPAERQQALRSALETHGRCEKRAGWTLWSLSPAAQQAARATLKTHGMLGAYVDN